MATTEAAVIGPERTDAIDVTLKGLDIVLQGIVQLVQGTIPSTIILAEDAREAWKACVEKVVAGRTDEVQATQQDQAEGMRRRLALARRGAELVRVAGLLAGNDLPGSDRLAAAVAEMERLQARVFERWHTAEDLEDLVAEATVPSPEQLQTIRERYGPPLPWYQQEGKPFDRTVTTPPAAPVRG